MTPYFILLRPRQWIKNLMLFFPPFLGGTILQPGIAKKGVLPFVAFCLISSAIYILNDICDIESDRRHPKKSLRPLPSGLIRPVSASILATTCVIFSSAAALYIASPFFVYLMAYVVISIAYTLWLKDVVLVDIFCISAGFLIRLLAGGEVFAIAVSHWLFLSVFLLSLFLSAGKRFGEKYTLGTTAASHRKALDDYRGKFLEDIMNITAAAVLVTYTMYVISNPSFPLIYTVPLCCFGLLRYIFRIHAGADGDPTASLTRDPTLFLIGVLWVTMLGWGIYNK